MRALRRMAVVGVVISLVAAVTAVPADGYEVTTTSVGGTGNTGVITFPSGLTATTTVGSPTYIYDRNSSISADGGGPQYFTPRLAASTKVSRILVPSNGCGASGTCLNRGSLTITFSRPVRDPVLNIAGLGGAQFGGSSVTLMHAITRLTSSTPAGIGLAATASMNNLKLTGNTLDLVNERAAENCDGTSVLQSYVTAPAGCGSVVLTGGAVTSVTFTFDLQLLAVGGGGYASTSNAYGDAFTFALSLPQDMSDAPASFNGSQAPAHIIGDLALGSGVPDADNTDTANPTSSPFAVAQGANANTGGDNASGSADENAFPNGLPKITVDQIGQPYNLSVPITGASSAGQVCGWIDWNGDNVFGESERACGSFAAGATTVRLAWTIPNTSSGLRYARFRASYNTAQAASPTGLADSGEVEDYSVPVYPVIKVAKVIANGAPGRFDLSVNGTVVLADAGNGDASAFKTVYNDAEYGAPDILTSTPPTASTPLTVTEAPAAGTTGSYTSAFSCVNGLGAVVASGTGTSATPSIPARTGTNGLAQQITCTFTNTLAAALTLVKTGTLVDTNGDGRQDAGDTINYTFTVTNTGGVPVTAVAISDPLVSPDVCDSTTLAPGASTTCRGSLVVTQAQADAGTVTNTATAGGTANGAAVNSPPSTYVQPLDAPASLVLTKAAALTDSNGDGKRDAGDSIRWTFTVTNTGAVTLRTVAVGDATAGPVTCAAVVLAPGASTTCTSPTKTVSTAQGDAGSITNTATVTATRPDGSAAPPSTASVTQQLDRTPALTLAKSATVTDVNRNGITDPGDRIQYSFVLSNTGNVTLSAPTVTDAKAGAVSCPAGSQRIPAGASVTCLADAAYVVTDADLTAGSVNNTATAAAADPSGAAVTSAPSTATVPVTGSANISLLKTAAVTDVNGNGKTDPGDTVTWSFRVTNSGQLPLTGVTVADPVAGTVTCPTTALAPGASTICTAPSHTVTQADADAGTVNNSATAQGTAPNGALVGSDPSSTSTPIDQASGLRLTKTAAVTDVNGNGTTDLGDTITWTFTLTNSGSVTLRNVAVTDPRAGTVTCAATTLAAGRSTTCTSAAYRIVQADVDAGTVANTATAVGVTPKNQAVTSNEASTVTPVPQVNKLVTTVTGTYTDVDGNGRPNVGDVANFSFTVTNTGNTTLTNITGGDSQPGPVRCPLTTLAPGQSMTCPLVTPHTITQDDVDAGFTDDTGSFNATPPSGPADRFRSDNATATIPIPPVAKLTAVTAGVVTDNNGNGRTDVGDDITWQVTVTNTGTVTTHDVTIDDAPAGTFTCPTTTLKPGESTVCVATTKRKVTQADVDSGSVSTTATARGLDPGNKPETSPPSTATVPTSSAAGVTITPTAVFNDVDGSGSANPGDTVTYTFTVTNSGGSTLDTTGVTDSLGNTVTCPSGPLAPGASVVCTSAPRPLTQAEIDAGRVTDTATATGRRGTGAPVTDTKPVTVTLPAAPEVSLVKKAALVDTDGNGGASVGETITYTFDVTNTGNVTLTNPTVADSKLGAVACPAGPLAPNATVICTAAGYTVTQADVDAGTVVNTATAHASTPGGGTTASTEESATVPAPRTKGLTLRKSAAVTDVDRNGSTGVGDTIAWTFALTNTGNTTLTNPVVNDPLAGPVTCPARSVAPGATVACAADNAYRITQADVDAGTVTNTATSAAAAPDGTNVTSNKASTTTPIAQKPSFTAVGAATYRDVDGDGVPSVGDPVQFTFVVTNTGDTTLSNLIVNDLQKGTVRCPRLSLAPGESITCAKIDTVPITQADVDAGTIGDNTRFFLTPPSGTPLPQVNTFPAIAIAPSTGLTLTKTATLTDLDGGGATAGDLIAWSFLVTNTGNVSVSDIVVTDPLGGPVTCPSTHLDGKASMTCKTDKQYVITQADVDRGSVINTATVAGTDPAGRTVTSAPATSTTPAVQRAALALVKTAATTDTGAAGLGVGDTIRWSFALTNTGTVTLDTLAVQDPTAGAVTCEAGTLAPKGSTTCTAAAHVITQADVDAGQVENTAQATAVDHLGNPVRSNPSSTDTSLEQRSALQLSKTVSSSDANGDGKVDLGDVVTWKFTITNPGTVTVASVAVTDTTAGPVTCAATTLAPGASTACTAATHTITQADIDAGDLVNTATAGGTDPADRPVASNTAEARLPIDRVSTLSLVKTGLRTDTGSDGIALGDTITWRFTVTNTGTTSVHSLAVADLADGPVTCRVADLAPGASTTCTAPPHIVNQDDIDNGLAANTATVTGGAPPSGTPIRATSTAVLPLPQVRGLRLEKFGAVTDVDGDGATSVGDTIAYTFRLTNTGTITLNSPSVGDPKAGPVTCPAAPLAPGASTTCTADRPYVIEQDEGDSGVVVNTAVANAVDLGGLAVQSNPATLDTPVVEVAALTLLAHARVNDLDGNGNDIGDTITYTYTVTNTGGLTLTNLTVNDLLAGPVSCPNESLAPGASFTCTATVPRTVTRTDALAGFAKTSAVATGTSPAGKGVPSNTSDTTVPIQQTDQLSIVPRAAVTDVNGDGLTDAGDLIRYTYVVTNTGTSTITDPGVDDPVAGHVTCPAGPLAPGESVTCTADAPHTITKDEQTARVVHTTPHATGTNPAGSDVVSPPAPLDVPVATPTPKVSVVPKARVVDDNHNGRTDKGDRIYYTYVVTNDGNVPLTDIGVSTDIAGHVTCPAPAGSSALLAAAVTTLAPGESITCAADFPHVVTDDDVKHGSVDDTVTGHGDDPSGQDVRSTPAPISTAVVPPASTSPAPPTSPSRGVLGTSTSSSTASTPAGAAGSGTSAGSGNLSYTGPGVPLPVLFLLGGLLLATGLALAVLGLPRRRLRIGHRH